MTRIRDGHGMIRAGFVTFAVETADKVSIASHEHATLAFGTLGSVSILSRERKRSVGRKWDVVGEWEYLANGNIRVTFTERSAATGLCATQMHRMGVDVVGLLERDFWHGIETIALASDGRTTNPDTLRGIAPTIRVRRNRNVQHERAKALSVNDMRIRLHKVRAKR